jgi:hypothetical protein
LFVPEAIRLAANDVSAIMSSLPPQMRVATGVKSPSDGRFQRMSTVC